MVSVSIVTYNTPLDEMARCLDSLRSELVGKIVVVDNARCAAMRDFCSQRPEVKYIASENRGFGAGHNIAISMCLAEGDANYHLVLNSDVRFKPEVIKELHDFMENNPDVGLVQPEVFYPDGRRQYTARLLPSPIDSFGRRFLPSGFTHKRNNRYLLKDIDRSRPFEAPYFQGSFLFLRCDALRDAGLFDERFFMYPEDIDLSRRIHTRWRTLCLPSVRIIHDHRAASYHSLRMTAIHAVNMARYFNKWGWIFDSERRRVNRDILRLNGRG